MALNRRGSVVRRDGRTGTSAEKSMIAHAHDGDGRRTKPADVGPPSVEEFHRIYNEGRERPAGMKAKDESAPEKLGDPNTTQRAKGYFNDVPLTGERSWLRGGGHGGLSRPTYDHQPEHRHSMAKGNKASGADTTKSPFSAAHIKPSFKRN
jgi:hypothetical protein